MDEAPETLYQLFRCPAVAVIGSSEASTEQLRSARRVGRLLAEAGVTVVTGGRDGVMEAACQGASRMGGMTVGILPGSNAEESPPNRFVQIPIYTGMADARNAVVVRTAGAVVAIGGGYGTLSEIGLALKAGRPVVLLDSWTLNPPASLDGMEDLLRTASSPQEAAGLAIALAGARIPIPSDPAEGSSGEDEQPAVR